MCAVHTTGETGKWKGGLQCANLHYTEVSGCDLLVVILETLFIDSHLNDESVERELN